MKKETQRGGISIDANLTLVYPLDDRHGLAYAVKEQTEKNNWNFSRQIPSSNYPDAKNLIMYSAFDDGSNEINLEKGAARTKILELNDSALSEFESGDMLPVMGILRQALRLSVMHFEWTHPLTLSIINNMVYTFGRTGNHENEYEGKFLLLQFVNAMMNNPPSMEIWQDSLKQIDEMVAYQESNGNVDMATALNTIKIFIA